MTRGTVKDHTPFDAEEDARRLRKAMKGFGRWKFVVCICQHSTLGILIGIFI